MEDLIIHTLTNLGFPAAICFYTLFGVNKSLQKLSATIDRLSDKVDKIDKLESELRELKFKIEHIK